MRGGELNRVFSFMLSCLSISLVFIKVFSQNMILIEIKIRVSVRNNFCLLSKLCKNALPGFEIKLILNTFQEERDFCESLMVYKT